MGKWLLGIITAVMTGVLTYWLTEGIHANLRPHGIAEPPRAASPTTRTYVRDDDEDLSPRRPSRHVPDDMRSEPAYREPRAVYGARYGASIAPIGYTAQAYCRMTGVMGQAHALVRAVEDCIDRGGISACCEQGARLIR